MKAFGILWQALKNYYEELLYLLLMGFLTVIACVLILPGPLAIAGLWFVGHRIIRGYGINFRTYWQGIKEYGLKTYLVVLIVVGVYLMLCMNLWFYSTSQISPISKDVAVWITSFWGLAAILWTGIIFYFEAFLIEQIEPKISVALRNSVALVLIHPFSTLIWLVFLALVVVISVVIPILLGLIPSMFAILSLTATRTLVKDIVQKQEQMKDEARTEATGEIVQDTTTEMMEEDADVKRDV
ncbi:MAG: hypothetical protein JXA33_08115 [Anaerolineae bacterium]|nr:hypothetical protein [Anaerolineae bacterium]